MRIATSSNVVRLYQWPLTGDIGDICIPHTSSDASVKTLSWNKDGTWLASVAFRKIPEVFKISGEQPMEMTDVHLIKKYISTCAAFQNTVKTSIVLGTAFKQVVTYDIQDRQVKHKFELLPAQINQVACTAKDAHIVAGLNNGEVKVYSNTTKRLYQTLLIPKSRSCTRLRCHSSKPNSIMAGSEKGIIALFDTTVRRTVYVDLAHAGPVTSISFSPPCCHGAAVTSGRDGTLVYHDINSMKRFAKYKMENVITALDFTPDGTSLITGSHNGEITVFDIRNREKPVHRFQAYQREITNVVVQKEETTEIPRSSSFFVRCKRGMPEPVNPQPETLNVSDSAMAVFIGEFEDTVQNLSCATDKPPIDTQPKTISTSTQTELAGIQQYDRVSKVEVKQIIEDELKSFLHSTRLEMQQELNEAKEKMERETLELQKSVVHRFLKVEQDLEKVRPELQANETISCEDVPFQEENNRLREKLMTLKEKLAQKQKRK